MEANDQRETEVSGGKDILKCGSCEHVSHEINQFLEHAETCQARLKEEALEEEEEFTDEHSKEEEDISYPMPSTSHQDDRSKDVEGDGVCKGGESKKMESNTSNDGIDKNDAAEEEAASLKEIGNKTTLYSLRKRSNPSRITTSSNLKSIDFKTPPSVPEGSLAKKRKISSAAGEKKISAFARSNSENPISKTAVKKKRISNLIQKNLLKLGVEPSGKTKESLRRSLRQRNSLDSKGSRSGYEKYSSSEDDDDELRLVERIMDKRVIDGQVEYFIKWTGLPHKDNTWESESILSQKLIANYENALPTKTQRRNSLETHTPPSTPFKKRKMENKAETSNKRSAFKAPKSTSVQKPLQVERKSKADALLQEDDEEIFVSYIPKPGEPGKFIVLSGEKSFIEKVEKSNVHPCVLLAAESSLRIENNSKGSEQEEKSNQEFQGKDFDLKTAESKNIEGNDPVSSKNLNTSIEDTIETLPQRRSSRGSNAKTSVGTPVLTSKVEELKKITFSDCIKNYRKIDKDLAKIPNTIQLVESDMPISESLNESELNAPHLFRQIVYSDDTEFACLICKNEHVFRTKHELAEHYCTGHELTVKECEARFDQDILFSTVPPNLTPETNIESSCTFCQAVLKTLKELKEHYSSVHSKTVHLVSDSATANLKSHFHCSLCSSDSASVEDHVEHVKSAHELHTHSCASCAHFSCEASDIRKHFKHKHISPRDQADCLLCHAPIASKQVLSRHILKMHSVQTSRNVWSCLKCLNPYKFSRTLLAHIPKCKIQASSKRPFSTDIKYKCSRCIQELPSRKDFETHQLKCEGDILDGHRCVLCSLVVPSAETLQDHHHHVHMAWVLDESIEDDTKYQETDDETSPDNSAAKKEIEHSTSKRILNDFHLNELGVHLEEGFRCQECESDIQNYMLFYHHMAGFHKAVKKFACEKEGCAEVFPTIEAYSQHDHKDLDDQIKELEDQTSQSQNSSILPPTDDNTFENRPQPTDAVQNTLENSENNTDNPNPARIHRKFDGILK